MAARLAAALGVPHRILTWTEPKPGSGIQAAAREARYRLLAAACRAAGAGDLLVAHHLEDQAETFLLRLRRGSGVDGLAAMPEARPLDAGAPRLRLLRPLLDLPRGPACRDGRAGRSLRASWIRRNENARLRPRQNPSGDECA